MEIKSYEQYQQAVKTIREDIQFMLDRENPRTKCIMIAGEPGIGKTYIAEEVLLNQTKRPYVPAKSISASSLFKAMWDDPDGIIMFDDSDKILMDKGDGATVLKAATDMYNVRELAWRKCNYQMVKIPRNLRNNEEIKQYVKHVADQDKKLQALHQRGELYPNRFYFTGLMVILTNKTLREISKATDGALANRAKHFELTFDLNGALELIKHASEIMTDCDQSMLKSSVDFLTSDDAVHYCERTGKRPTFRTINKVIEEIEKGRKLDAHTLETCLEFPTFKEE